MARAKQYADRVNVIKRIKLGSKWPFAPVVEQNGRIVRDHVWVAGRDEHHPEGRYYLEWYEVGPEVRESVAGRSRKIHPTERSQGWSTTVMATAWRRPPAAGQRRILWMI